MFVYEIFTADGTFNVPTGVTSVDALIVAGGGGGGGKTAGNIVAVAGGGAGGLVELLNYTVTPLDTISITIGAGGAGAIGSTSTVSENGGDSIFGTETAIGGGAGGGTGNYFGTVGGSGGGSTQTSGLGAAGTSGQGNKGGERITNSNGHKSGGGGGFGSAGNNGSATVGTGGGGTGFYLADSSVWKGAIYYGAPWIVAAGGGGGRYSTSGGTNQPGSGGNTLTDPSGAGSGGDGGSALSNGGDGLANTGGGGGGGGGNGATSGNATNGGSGGSGIVIVRYEIADEPHEFEIFTSDATFSVPGHVSEVDVLIVGGGGGGGVKPTGNNVPGAGGGAGGVVLLENFSVTPGSSVSIVVGAGGSGGVVDVSTSTDGEDSSFGAEVAVGGGAGGSVGTSGGNGGSGGGAPFSLTPGLGTTDQGYDGAKTLVHVNYARSGGGGGAGHVGIKGGVVPTTDNSSGGHGGTGLDLSTSKFAGSISLGAPSHVGGGGGGAAHRNSNSPATGGRAYDGGGAGGQGSTSAPTSGADGTANTGGGGGGAGGGTSSTGQNGRVGGAGGSGIVIVRYRGISIVPNFGAVNQFVTIIGTGFADATGVLFGTESASGFNLVDSTTIECNVPASLLSGLYDVTIQRSSTDVVIEDGFTVTDDPPPVISSIDPVQGSISGGTVVVLTGEGFTGTTGVTFDGIAATDVVVVNDTTVTCEAPAHVLGVVDVEITTPVSSFILEDGFEYIAGARLTQLPTLVVSLSNANIKASQLPVIVICLPNQQPRITQAPVLSAWLPVPIPPPGPLMPEVPIIETWQYKTVVTISEQGKEQRSSLRLDPRVLLSHTALIVDDEDYRKTYEFVTYFLNKTFVYPSYTHSSIITAETPAGNNELYFNPTATDLRSGESIAIFNPVNQSTEFYVIDTVTATGAILTENINETVQVGFSVCPALLFGSRTNLNIEMNAIDGSLALDFVSANVRSVLRPDQATNLLTTIDGFVVLNKRQLANDKVARDFNQDVIWLDNDIGPAEPRTSRKQPYFEGNLEYFVLRPLDLDYWRQFADTVKGAWKSFLLPTFRKDLTLYEQPALNSTEIKVTNIRFNEIWRSRGWQYISIQSASGTRFRRINEVIVNYSLDGKPESLTVKLNENIGSTVGSNENMVISFMNRVRLANDDFVFEHSYIDSTLKLEVKLVEQ